MTEMITSAKAAGEPILFLAYRTLHLYGGVEDTTASRIRLEALT